MKCKLIQEIRQGKDNMKIGHWKEFSFPIGKPFLPVFALALWAVSIATTIIADPSIATIGTRVNMTAQVGGTTAV